MLPDARALDAERALRDLFAGFGSALVAFSGGVDSAYLAWIAHDVLGDRALAVTALSESYPAHHYDLALTLARQAGFPHEVVHTHEIDRPEYPGQPGQSLLLLQGRALHRPRRRWRARAGWR